MTDGNLLCACSTCSKEFPRTLEFFLPRRSSVDGMARQCRECYRANYRRYTLEFNLFSKANSHLLEAVPNRFWSHVQKTQGCWEWTGVADIGKRGRLGVGPKSILAPRIAWWLFHGVWPPDGLSVCHHCDNPSCVRKEHLFLGTQSDNMRDAIIKVRTGKRMLWPNSTGKSQCLRGHPLIGDNLLNTTQEFRRYCKMCRRIYGAERRERLRKNRIKERASALLHGRMTTQEAAMYLKCSVNTLKKYRWLKIGPRFVKAGRVVYLKADLDAWVLEHRAKAA